MNGLAPHGTTRGSFRVATLVAASVALGGCNIYACRYETRFIATSGAGSSPTIGSVTVESLNFRDYSEGEAIPRTLTWRINASELVGQPSRLSVRDERDTTQVVADLSITGSNGVLSASALLLETAAQRDRVYAVLAANAGVLLVYGATAGAPPLRVHLNVTAREGWHRPNCD